MCCTGFDYGNAENHMGADGAGTMEAIVSLVHATYRALQYWLMAVLWQYFGNCTSWWVASDKAKIPKVRARIVRARERLVAFAKAVQHIDCDPYKLPFS